jgi:glyoxylase-like metal-dependent hydrolase (beta-lactamase superfamily II)
MTRLVSNEPEIYCVDIPLPDSPLKNLNCYIISSRGKCLVIDTGYPLPECSQALFDGLKDIGVDTSDVSLFLTHMHNDQIGLAGAFAERGCEIYMSEIDYGYFARFDLKQRLEEFLREGFPQEELELLTKLRNTAKYRLGEVFPATQVSDGFSFLVGDVQFQCVTVPGHTLGHTCLYIPRDEIMFLGDHILFDITPNITFWREVKDSLRDYLHSLDKIAAYPMKLALPAHRGYDGNVYERIHSIKAHHAARLREVAEIACKEPDLTAYEIAARMQWKMREKNWNEFSIMPKWFAAGEATAHLRYLISDGTMERKETNGVFRYKCKSSARSDTHASEIG